MGIPFCVFFLGGGGGGFALPFPLKIARLIYAVGRGTRTSPLLKELHWLPFSKRFFF